MYWKKAHHYLCQTKFQITKIMKTSHLSLIVQCKPNCIIPLWCQKIQYFGYPPKTILVSLSSSISGETFSKNIFKTCINRKQMLNLAINRYIYCRDHQSNKKVSNLKKLLKHICVYWFVFIYYTRFRSNPLPLLRSIPCLWLLPRDWDRTFSKTPSTWWKFTIIPTMHTIKRLFQVIIS